MIRVIDNAAAQSLNRMNSSEASLALRQMQALSDDMQNNRKLSDLELSNLSKTVGAAAASLNSTLATLKAQVAGGQASPQVANVAQKVAASLQELQGSVGKFNAALSASGSGSRLQLSGTGASVVPAGTMPDAPLGKASDTAQASALETGKGGEPVGRTAGGDNVDLDKLRQNPKLEALYEAVKQLVDMVKSGKIDPSKLADADPQTTANAKAQQGGTPSDPSKANANASKAGGNSASGGASGGGGASGAGSSGGGGGGTPAATQSATNAGRSGLTGAADDIYGSGYGMKDGSAFVKELMDMFDKLTEQLKGKAKGKGGGKANQSATSQGGGVQGNAANLQAGTSGGGGSQATDAGGAQGSDNGTANSQAAQANQPFNTEPGSLASSGDTGSGGLDPMLTHENIWGLINMVMQQTYKESVAGMKDVLAQVQANNATKKGIRGQLDAARKASGGNASDTKVQKLTDDLQSAGDDSTMLQQYLQNLTQEMQQTMQMMTSLSKVQENIAEKILQHIA